MREFRSAREHAYLQGKPMLLMANKQDAGVARSEGEVNAALGVSSGGATLAQPCVALPKHLTRHSFSPNSSDRFAKKPPTATLKGPSKKESINGSNHVETCQSPL